MVTDSLSTISRLSLLDAGNNFSAAFLDAGGDTNAAVAPPEGAARPPMKKWQMRTRRSYARSKPNVAATS